MATATKRVPVLSQSAARSAPAVPAPQFFPQRRLQRRHSFSGDACGTWKIPDFFPGAVFPAKMGAPPPLGIYEIYEIYAR